MRSASSPVQFQMLGAREACKGGWPHIEQQVLALEEAVDRNPGLAFDLAKTLLESACKTVLTGVKRQYDDRWELPRLLKETLEQLRLVPEEIAQEKGVSESLRKTAGGLQTVIQGICELRNAYGFASHGKGPSFQQLESVHALVVARATDVIVDFIFRVYREYSVFTPAKPLTYEDNVEFNEYVDNNNEPVRIFNLEYSPSEVLFKVDPDAYYDLLLEFNDQSNAATAEPPLGGEGEVAT